MCQVAAHAPGDIAAALRPTAFHTERKPCAQAMDNSSPVGAAGTRNLRPGSSGGPSSAAVVDIPDGFMPQAQDHALASCSPDRLDTSAISVRVAVSQSAGGVFAAASASLGPGSRAGSSPQLSEAHTQAALHAALCAMQAGVRTWPVPLICPAWK